ncbi:unnamed protein product [Auanema sp. JU1783]|nr:unnamed protein product [Auanema sp. JU1783]
MLDRHVVLSIFVVSIISVVQSDSLYDASDPILELYTDTFNENVYASKKGHFVEFYSSWCGACIGYAPTWKKFARHLSTWSSVVQVTVVNCADDKNMPLCREHSIAAFPTIKYFKYQAVDKNDGIPYSGNKHELAQMELDVAALVQADWERQSPPDWPSFNAIENSETLDDMWAKAGDASFIGLTFQENPSTMAWANIINFHKDRNALLKLARPQHPLAVQSFADNANNRFVLYTKNNPKPVWESPENVNWVEIQEKINELVTEVGGAFPAPVEVQPVLRESQAVSPNSAAVDLSQYQVQLLDLQSTLSYMLYKEIPRRNEIGGEDLAGLKQWTHTLKKYAPGTTPMRRLLYRLDEWLQLKNQVTADEWTVKIDELQSDLGNPLPKEVKWVACTGSKPNLRGYTCGLWTLAHAISAEAYKSEKQNTNFRPVIEILEPFKQFITRFLSCSECAQNFAKEAENHQLHLVTRAEDTVMWLWKVHNFVNKRLSGSASDDPKHPKQQFPPKAVCPECFDAAGNYDESKVFDFVNKYYLDIKQDKIQPESGYNVKSYKDGKLEAVGSRHLNPKFAIHAEKVDRLEAAENRLRKELDASPQRQWRDIEGYDGYKNAAQSSRAHFYLIWLSVIGLAGIFVYCKYRRNRSKFWKTFYYHNDFKLCPWSSGSQAKQYTA